MKTLARILSIILHPLFIPLYGLMLYVSIQSPMTLNLRMLDKEVFFKLAVSPILLFSIVFPLFSLMIMYRNRMVSSFTVNKRKERLPVLFLGVIYYGITYYFLRTLDAMYHYTVFGFFLSFLSGGIVLSLLSLIITSYWKISLHAIGMGALTGAFIAFSQELYPIANIRELVVINTVLLILTGLIGSVRLMLGSHNLLQIFAGTLLGLTIEFLFISKHFWI